MRKHAILLGAVLLSFVSALSYAQAPVPFINLPLMPDATAPGGAQFTLTVNGTGFVANSVVNWNGSALATQVVNGSKLTAIVPAVDIATASTAWVTVVNPAPGGGMSNEAFFTVTANTGKSVGFGLASSPAFGYPLSAAVGDFNGDGQLDLAVTDTATSTVSILLGDGTGNFTLASSTSVGSYPESVTVGDFNADGKLDLAVANGDSGTVSILLGDGAGNFTLTSSPQVGSGPNSVATGDFNGDGKLDLAVANGGSGTVSILLGDGAGNFTLVSSPAAYSPNSLVVGDFNGDGKLDLAVANNNGPYDPGTVSILLGDGTGNFTLASSPAVGIWPNSVAVGDFNGDGKLDLAVANMFSCTISVLLGDGTGNFTKASSPATACWLYFVVTGDFNGDGKLDLASIGEWASFNPNPVDILLGNGAGKFKLASSPLVGGCNISAAVGDFNGDGKLDLAVVNCDGTVPILLGAVPPVLLSPTNLRFPTQLIGTHSGAQPVTLTNIGTGTRDIRNIATNSLSFSQTNNCPSSLPPGGQCTINVTFNPDKSNQVNGDLTIRDNAPTSPQKVPLNGIGTAVALSPSNLAFGNQQVGTTSPPQPVTLANHGTQAVSIVRIHFVGTNRGAFAQTNNCGTSVPAGGNCTINVTFTPKSKNVKTATLEVFDNGGASPQTVALSGTGTE